MRPIVYKVCSFLCVDIVWVLASDVSQINTSLVILQFRFIESSWNVMAHGDAREGKWRGNWRMEWVACTLHTTSEYGVSSINTADANTSAASSRLNWRPAVDLNGLVRFAESRNLISSRVSSHFKSSLHVSHVPCLTLLYRIGVMLFETGIRNMDVAFLCIHTNQNLSDI